MDPNCGVVLSKQWAFFFIYREVRELILCVKTLMACLEERFSESNGEEIESRGNAAALTLVTFAKDPLIDLLYLHAFGELTDIADRFPLQPCSSEEFTEIDALKHELWTRLSDFQEFLEETIDDMAAEAFGFCASLIFQCAREVDAIDVDEIIEYGVDVWPVYASQVIEAWTTRELTQGDCDAAVAIYARNKWIYEQVMAGVKYSDIIRGLKASASENKWRLISTTPGLKAAAMRHAERHDLPKPPLRPPGRPSGS